MNVILLLQLAQTIIIISRPKSYSESPSCLALQNLDHDLGRKNQQLRRVELRTKLGNILSFINESALEDEVEGACRDDDPGGAKEERVSTGRTRCFCAWA